MIAGFHTLFKRLTKGSLLSFCLTFIIACGSASSSNAQSRSIRIPWSNHAHDAQHTAISPFAAQPLNRVLWQAPIDLNLVLVDNEVLIHYGSPLITRSNTVIVPVKTGSAGGFRVEAHAGTNGAIRWMKSSDYILPDHIWIPSFEPTLTPKNRLYFPGGGGTLYYCDTPDTTNTSPTFSQVAFYGLTNYLAATNSYLANVLICTPLTSDRYGNVYFGFQVTGATPLNLQSGVARIDPAGNGSWVAASSTVSNDVISTVAVNCAPALANDHRKLYITVNNGYGSYGYLVALDSRTLAPLANVRLKDVQFPDNDLNIYGDGSGCPTVGPDGDVYYGGLESPWYSNNDRGWLLHFDSTLATNKFPGAFGWDDTASIVPASLVPSYHGASSYLLMTKYNNYAGSGLGGDGINRIAILDPNDSEIDPVTGASVMKVVLAVASPTPDLPNRNSAHPYAVKEWCINTAAVDPARKSIIANNEDGRMYRWDLTSNTLAETNIFNDGIGEAYTPTVIGVDGTVYGINNAILYAIGR